jgi:hypothetical protein
MKPRQQGLAIKRADTGLIANIDKDNRAAAIKPPHQGDFAKAKRTGAVIPDSQASSGHPL